MEAGSNKTLVQVLVGFEETFGRSTFEGMHKYVVTVIIVQYHNIVVASAANRDKFSGLVGVNLAGGIKRGNKTLMGFGLFADWEGIGMGFIGWGNILGIGGNDVRLFG